MGVVLQFRFPLAWEDTGRRANVACTTLACLLVIGNGRWVR
jgi:hypothetical protein